MTVYDASVELEARARASHATPLCVVEIVTPTPRDSRRDRVEKRRDYAKAKIRFYWIVDPTMRTVEVFELSRDGRYTTAAAAASGKLRVRGLAGLVIDLDALFAAIDRLEQPKRRKRS